MSTPASPIALSTPPKSSSFTSLYSPFSSTTSYQRPSKKQRKMSLTQTYYLAHAARAKLSREASRPDHDLRILVGHANMLDSLMLDLADAEREQERWFHQSVRGANDGRRASKGSRHIQWAEAVVEEPEEDWEVEDGLSHSDEELEDSDGNDEDEDDDDSDDYDEEVTFTHVLSLSKSSKQQQQQQQRQRDQFLPKITTREIIHYADDEEAIESDDDADDGELALTRTTSRSQRQQQQQQQPPDLLEDSENDSSEDELFPLSPPQPTIDTFPTSQIRRHSEGALSVPVSVSVPVPASGSLYSKRSSEQSLLLEEGGFFLQRERGAMIEAF
ncbi:uncharacterized protein PADG_01397 [Paracoccidioides brasiliensis Pb18]|uniref:Protein ECM13 n=1 Tax=Paracoccidioides brasiliensis (strain Pb18) TaxID=502780 RepID=C1G381_PARBD|nr:uncharacterized protein PADG_01397 [Paracoccidioides brasiliensis Pb18]EEH45247.1 hypothetical protein PADG_01397 [Paracoccidioides brasiliensis Pb18]